MGVGDHPGEIMKTLAFFNNKGGVGKTTILFHLAHMFAMSGVEVVVADLDPQANLTAMLLDEDRLEQLWQEGGTATIHTAMQPLIEGTGDILETHLESIGEHLSLLCGDLGLSNIEDELSNQWPRCLGREARAFRVTAAFDRMLRLAGERKSAAIGLIDVGPNLGAINRCALISADYVVVPIGADLFSIKGLQNVGPKLQEWRNEWRDRIGRAPLTLGFALPEGSMRPIGYVVSRFTKYKNEPSRAYQKWLDRAPAIFAEMVAKQDEPSRDGDRNRIAQLKDYRSLMPMAQEARKPMFLLKPADGAIGAQQAGVEACRADFKALADEIGRRIGLD